MKLNYVISSNLSHKQGKTHNLLVSCGTFSTSLAGPTEKTPFLIQLSHYTMSMIFFHSVAVTDEHQPSSSFIPTKTAYDDSNFRFSSLLPLVVYSLLSKLDVKKSVGPNGLSSKFLKEIASEIGIPLSKLFNKSLETGVFPSDFKRSCNVTPIHKCDAKDNPGNFHPISVVSIVAKL